MDDLHTALSQHVGPGLRGERMAGRHDTELAL